MDLVSIIVPVYNTEAYLPDCLDSITKQTYKNIEIILVDDGSSDDSGRICDEYAKRDNRIIVIHKENGGVSSARIDGFNLSNGEFIMFVDSDDYLSCDCVCTMMKAQVRYGVSLVCGQYYNLIDNRIEPQMIRPSIGYYDRNKIDELLATNFLFDKRTKIAGCNPYIWSKLIRREFAEKCLYVGKQLFYGEDQVGVLNLLYNVETMYVIADRGYFYRSRSGGATATYSDKLWEEIEKYFCILWCIDHRKLMEEQMIYRMLCYTIHLTKMSLKHYKTVGEFCDVLSQKRYLSFVVCAIENRKLWLNAPGRRMLWLLKVKWFKVMYSVYFMRYHLKL